MSLDIVIQEGALFIADAHESSERSFFLEFLNHLLKTPPPQLFLMGDMFDVFIGGIAYTKRIYKPYIKLINDLSQMCEIFYFEGNHDFNLKKLFPKVHVIAIQQQPRKALFLDGTTCLLLHGDKYEKRLYRLYTAFIRHPVTLSVLNSVDSCLCGGISKRMMKSQKRKQLCRPIADFKALVDAKIKDYPLKSIDVIAEGHYHQDTSFAYDGLCYINFSSFACTQSYFRITTTETIKFVPVLFKNTSL